MSAIGPVALWQHDREIGHDAIFCARVNTDSESDCELFLSFQSCSDTAFDWTAPMSGEESR